LYPGLSIPAVQDGKEYHWPTVVNASYAALMRHFFISSKQDKQDAINALEATNEIRFKGEVDGEIFARSKQYGLDVAAAVWEWEKTDVAGHDAYLDPFANYDWNTHYNKLGDWVPTLPGPGKPMYAHWGDVRTFAIRQSDKLCPAPWAYGEDKNNRLYAEAVETYARTANATYDDKWMGEFWSDDLVDLTFSPGPRWLAIADEVLNEKQSSLETALYASVKVGMATSDCAVACWYSKYYYNIERPETYIRRVIDPSWHTALNNPLNQQTGLTPSFPAFPSGHSTMGGGAAEVLTDIFGIHFAMSDRCHENRNDFIGTPRSFGSFYEMAEENAISRVPLGVHFRMDCEQGVALGYRVGRRVNELPWKK
ncbi:MAG: vanadium-dependent haloperoxidase, partial [Saprospiraceae bacterium]